MRGIYIGEDYPREEYDVQERYMATWLRMIGITQITVEKTLLGPEPDHAEREKARKQAEALAATL